MILVLEQPIATTNCNVFHTFSRVHLNTHTHNTKTRVFYFGNQLNNKTQNGASNAPIGELFAGRDRPHHPQSEYWPRWHRFAIGARQPAILFLAEIFSSM